MLDVLLKMRQSFQHFSFLCVLAHRAGGDEAEAAIAQALGLHPSDIMESVIERESGQNSVWLCKHGGAMREAWLDRKIERAYTVKYLKEARAAIESGVLFICWALDGIEAERQDVLDNIEHLIQAGLEGSCTLSEWVVRRCDTNCYNMELARLAWLDKLIETYEDFPCKP